MNPVFHDSSGVPVDPVTALYRLGGGGPSLTAVLASAQASRRHVALLHVDIDMLQLVNVNMGEEVGDQVLAAVAQRLRSTMPEEATLWRLCSDEFIACIAYRDGEPSGEALAELFRDALEGPLSIPPYTLPVTVSIGIAVYPEHGTDAAAMLASEVFSAGPEADELRDRALRISQLAAKLLAGPSADLAATAGLLSEVGLLLPRSSGIDPATTPYSVTGAYLLGLWGLPGPIVEAVAFHDKPAKLRGSFWVTGAVHVAAALVNGREPDEAYLRSVGQYDRLPGWRELAAAG